MIAAGRPTRSPALVLDLDGIAVPLQVRRHPRARRVTLRLAPGEAGVVIVLPPGVGSEEGLRLARAHAGWIRSRLDARLPAVPFADGAVVPVAGEALTLRLVAGERRGARREGSTLVVGGDAAGASARVHAWLKATARRAILDQVTRRAALLPRPPAAVTLRDTRSRWGSCSPQGRLSFSWRLILAPPFVLDYVVAHELAHLRHHGHGPAFWAAVDDLGVDAAGGRAWLRRHGGALFRYG